MPENNEIRHVNATRAAAMARASIFNAQVQSGEPRAEDLETPNSNFDPRISNSDTGWPITRANIPGAEPGESPLIAVFRQARTEIGGWGTQAFREGGEASAAPREPTPFNPVRTMLSGPRRTFGELYGIGGSTDGGTALIAPVIELGRYGIMSRPGGGAIVAGDDRETEPPPPLPSPSPKPAPVPGPVRPRPRECTCTLQCHDLESGQESPNECKLELWCEAIGPGNTEYKFTPLRGILELHGTGEDVSWEIITTGQSPDRYIQLSAVDSGQINKLKGDPKIRLTGIDPCNQGTRYVFAIVPASTAVQKLFDGDLEPVSEDIIALINGEECARFTVTIQPIPCDEAELKAKAAALNERSPNVVCFTFLNTADPVANASELPGNPAADSVLAISIDVELAISTSTLFECADCCCEYYDHGFLWVNITAQWVKGAKGAAQFATGTQEKLSALFNGNETLGGLTALIKQAYPKCFRSKACPTPTPQISYHSLDPDLYTVKDLHERLVGIAKSKDDSAKECLAEAAEAAARYQQERWPSQNDLAAGGGAKWISLGGWKPFFSSHEFIVEELQRHSAATGQVIALNDSDGLIGYIKLYIDVHSGFEVRRHAAGSMSCWCVVGTGFLVKISGEIVIRRDLPDIEAWADYGRQYWDNLTASLNNNIEAQKGFLSQYVLKVPNCFPDLADADRYLAELTKDATPYGSGWLTRRENITPLQCGRIDAHHDFLVANARGLVTYRQVAAGRDIWGKPDWTKGTKEYAELNSNFSWQQFRATIPKEPASKPCCFLIWVHGYNTNEAEGLDNLDVIRSLYNGFGGCCQLVGFLWHGDPGTKLNFGQAIAAANISSKALMDLVSYLKQNFLGATVSVAAHSLGTRVALQAAKYLPKGSIDDLILFNAAVDYDVLDVGEEFGDVPAIVDKVWVVFNRRDDALIATSLPLAPYGPYYWAQHNVALGARGPKHPGKFSGEVESIDMTALWNYQPRPDETTHSALYVWRISSSFFGTRFPFMVAGDRVFCARK